MARDSNTRSMVSSRAWVGTQQTKLSYILTNLGLRCSFAQGFGALVATIAVVAAVEVSGVASVAWIADNLTQIIGSTTVIVLAFCFFLYAKALIQGTGVAPLATGNDRDIAKESEQVVTTCHAHAATPTRVCLQATRCMTFGMGAS